MRILLALAFLAVPAAAFAADVVPGQADRPAASTDADAQAEAKAEEPRERRICTTSVATGSNMPRRVCRTVAQIDADNQAARDTRDRMNRSQ